MTYKNLPWKTRTLILVIVLLVNLLGITSAKAIQGGESAKGTTFVVAIVIDLTASEAELCTGGLIAPRLVVTSGHCVIQNGVTFPLQSISIYPPGSELISPGKAKVQQILIPSGYRNDSEKAEPNDIAFLVMDRPIDGGTVIQKVADNVLAKEIVRSGTSIRAYGYGITGAGQEPPGFPKSIILKPTEQEFIEGFQGKENTYLNYAQEDSGSVCTGDSGGPAVAQYQGQLVLISVTSASSGICSPSLGDNTNWGTIPGEFPELLNLALQSANTPIPQPSPTVTTAPTIKKTIICVKGKKTKRITAVKPKCPTGYTLKKK